MTFRNVRLIGLAVAAVSFAVPALAGEVQSGGIPVAGNNVVIGTAVGAGIGNNTYQRLQAAQGTATPWGGSPLVSTNTAVATAVAAGIGNTTRQDFAASQSSGPTVTFNPTGRGPLITTNVDVATPVAAGIGNITGQRLGTMQR